MNSQYTKSRCSECLSSLQGMLKRERTTYSRKRRAPTSTSSSSSSSVDSDYTSLRRSLIDVYDEVFQLCQLQNRDTVAVAVSYLDRFMEQQRFVNVQLAAMTCFYLAVKLYEPTVIPPAMLCELFQRTLDFDEEDEDVDDDISTGTVATAESIESMEMQLLVALKWNLNPPTSMMFVRHILGCLPDANLMQWKQAALALAQSHLDAGLKAEEMMGTDASTLAVAALFAAVESLPATHRAPVYKFILQAVHMTAAEQQRQVLMLSQVLKKLAASDETPAVMVAVVDTKRPAMTTPCVEEERPAKKQRVFVEDDTFITSPRSTILA